MFKNAEKYSIRTNRTIHSCNFWKSIIYYIALFCLFSVDLTATPFTFMKIDSLPDLSTYSYKNIRYFNKNNWLVHYQRYGKSEFLKRTTDAGSTWDMAYIDTMNLESQTNKFPVPIVDYGYIDKDIFYITCSNDDTTYSKMTYDGGKTYTNYPKFSRTAVSFINKDTLISKKFKIENNKRYILGISFSYDGGTNWIDYELPENISKIRNLNILKYLPNDSLLMVFSDTVDNHSLNTFVLYNDMQSATQIVNTKISGTIFKNSLDWYSDSNDAFDSERKRYIVETHNAGADWDTICFLEGYKLTLNIYMANKGSKILCTGENNLIAYSNNNGKDWWYGPVDEIGYNWMYMNPYFINENEAIILNTDNLYRFNFQELAVDNVQKENNFKLYPNPIYKGQSIFISNDRNMSNNAEIEIYDISGELVFSKQYTDIASWSNALLLNLPNIISSGTYSIIIKTENKSYRLPLVIE